MPPVNQKKKNLKKKVQDPFGKKDWFFVRAPSTVFPAPHAEADKLNGKNFIGRTTATKSSGNKSSRDSLIGRVVEVSLGDLKPNSEDDAFRLFRLRIEEVQGRNALTNFYGMRLARDKLCSLVRKWHSLIETAADIKTSDGFTLRVSCIGFTKAQAGQRRKTSYAQTSQIRVIRKKMTDIIQRECNGKALNELVPKFITETIGKEIEKATQGTYPLQNVLIHKVKTLRMPKLDITRLLDSHGGAAVVADLGKIVERPAEEEAVEEVEVAAE
jgi:small subunit ribosomal protein S3Ae